MKRMILMSCGELMLKGQNRPLFERRLVQNIKKNLNKYGAVDINLNQGKIYLKSKSADYPFDKAVESLGNISGIAVISLAVETDKNYDSLHAVVREYLEEVLAGDAYKTFKVEAKRADKSYPYNSPELARKLGEDILGIFDNLKVDLHNPDLRLYVEIRDNAYIYHKKLKGNGGLPVGTNGKGMLLLSGGIDSPAAGWMMAKRGLAIEGIHFFSFPYTGLKSKEKVIDIAKVLSEYTGSFRLHIIPFTEIQLYINENCPEEYSVIIMRRIMIRIANLLSKKTKCKALITGESMGQVASQTIEALTVTNEISELPVFRPLIGMDKTDVIDIARKINTYEISTLPYEDCCTVFVPRHPKIKPRLKEVEEIETNMKIDDMIVKALEDREVINLD